ncbi:hypothetical protein BGW38_003638, partial [Lunasporangiospora selenospora]
PEVSSGQLYVLEMKSRTLTKLGKETEKRAYMACAATQYSFFAWGGLTLSWKNVANATPLIFNSAVGDWVNSNIIPPPPPPPPVVPLNPDSPSNGTGAGAGSGNGRDSGKGNGRGAKNNDSDSSDSGSSQLNIAAIAGGAGGVIALIALVVILFIVARKRRKSSEYDDWKYPSNGSSEVAEILDQAMMGKYTALVAPNHPRQCVSRKNQHPNL